MKKPAIAPKPVHKLAPNWDVSHPKPTKEQVVPELSESAIQSEIVRYVRNNFCLKHHSPRSKIFHIPNENTITMYNEGVEKGCADLCFLHHAGYFVVGTSRLPDVRTIYIEVKTPKSYASKNNGLSPAQMKWRDEIVALGFPYHVVCSLEMFKEKVLGENKEEGK